MEPIQLYLVCQDVDLGYHVYAICSTREKAEQYIDDCFALRLHTWEMQYGEMRRLHNKMGFPWIELRRPEREDMHFHIEERILDEAATL